ncbi:Tol biopolymer transport system component [Rhizomicrobium palustre]|uniref:Tol biopolymer transport system component n=1 Tax=Rhizomicrobium palustre TaxID=189966 RepID=A0A846MWT0_9PROT|nr:DPP IV N-terminal domain-containing protein [Rhizomicrobium palustre]NIK88008.1 Tol biopolymer transport system component [Rhizomicrobium palustre]
MRAMWVFLAGLLMGAPGFAGELGLFDAYNDIGKVSPPGTASYDAAQGSYTLTAAGANVWGKEDAFHFLWKKMSGDFALTAEVVFPPKAYPKEPNPHRKALLMIRQDLSPGSVYADVAPHGVGLTALQYRPEKDGATHDIELNIDFPKTVRLEKRGDVLTMFISEHGEALHQAGASTRLHFTAPFYVGLGLTSHEEAITDKVVFNQVRLEMPEAETGKTTTWSTLNLIKIDPGAPTATIIEHKQGIYESPNVAADKKSVLINEDGKFFRIPLKDPLAGGAREAVLTGEASGCWGEHGYSPDGKWLAVSCKAPGENGPDVHIVPAQGGAARRLTHQPISFFHGWSPDGKTIAFTSIKDGHEDIYTVPVSGGAPTRLTTEALNDGAEFTPDGRYLYFNSNRSGAMQIWRMRPDGSAPEQITKDGFDDWYPHISPDGKWLVMLSYKQGEATASHPMNKQVALRLMSLTDGSIRVLHRLTGGQGTLDSPCWSPDSKLIGFVSYSDIAEGTK